jgi:hypothetical protein
MQMKNSNDTIGNRSLDLPVCSAVPQPSCQYMDSCKFHKKYMIRMMVNIFTCRTHRRTFQERGKTTGRNEAIVSKERHFSPLAAILENRRVTLFHYVDMVPGITPVGITQNDRFLSCDTDLLGVRYSREDYTHTHTHTHTKEKRQIKHINCQKYRHIKRPLNTLQFRKRQ